MRKSPVTGEDVPDESARELVKRYVNPRTATWPDADFIIGNPPFVGNKRMRSVLGDGYVEALRAAHDDVPETSDYVMYWWNLAAELVGAGKVRRFGLITTNSITQIFNRKVVESHLAAKDGISIVFAVPDHPWVDSEDGAAVRIAMTVGDSRRGPGLLQSVLRENQGDTEGVDVTLAAQTGVIHSDLRVGANVSAAQPLRGNGWLCRQGVKLVGAGFLLEQADLDRLGLEAGRIVRPFLSNKDLVRRSRGSFAIDFFGLDEEAARAENPIAFQRLLDLVKPLRAHNRDAQRRRDWWLFGRTNKDMRSAIFGLRRMIVTPEVAKYRPFSFAEGSTIPDASLYVVGSDDAWILGVLSSRVHAVWALTAGGRLGVGNDPRYHNTRCFDPFPFPAPTESEEARIRELGEALDQHRKRQQAEHPTLTITGMYNVLGKLRAAGTLTAKEKRIHEQGLVSVLKEIHDELDAAVFGAYGWSHDLMDEQLLGRLVALNAERAEEERRGLVRWLRPEFQNPSGIKPESQVQLIEGEEGEAAPAAPSAKGVWPKKLPAQIAAVRDLVLSSEASWTIERVASSFKGARRTDVEAVLESLAALGVALCYGDGTSRKWRRVGRVAA